MTTLTDTPGREAPAPALGRMDPLVAAFRDRIRPGGRVLAIGVDGGSNTVPLAQAGLRVVGIDPAAEALAATTATAAAAGCRLELHRATFREYEPDGPFDAVLCLDVMPGLSRAECASLVHRIHAWTVPGSLLLLSARHVDDPSYDRISATWERVGLHSFRSPDGRYRTFLARGVVRNLFRSWKILHHREEQAAPDPGNGVTVEPRPGRVELVAVRKLV